MEEGIYGPKQPVMEADLGVQPTSVGTAQRMSGDTTLSCDCTASETIWADETGKIISTSQLWENTMKDTDLTQVFRLMGYAKDHPGVLALELGASEQ